ncbi:MAG: restriction endonuclease [Candidatus Saccharibacteria bacterium]
MSRYSRSRKNDMPFTIIILLSAVVWTHRLQFVSIVCISLVLIGFIIILQLCPRFIKSRRFVSLHAVDSMDGLEFEYYIAGLLRKNGYYNISLTEKYDFGVDIIAEKDGVHWGIQVKRRSKIVKAEAVRQVVTGLRFYDCDRAMVITNSSYSTFARQLAISNNCVLINRVGLKRLMRQE